jgi:predicted RNA-binding Zn ribbon-like protein
VSFTIERFTAEGFGKRYAWIDFVNSEEYNGFGILSDHLADATWVKVFLRHWTLGNRFGKKADICDLRFARNFLRRVAKTIAGGKRLSNRDLKTLNRALRIPVHRLLKKRRDASYALDLVPPRQSCHWVRAEIFSSLASMLAEGQQHRLKICPNPGCRWVFFDQTHGNSRKWCSDLTCGNRDKVRRLRARRAACIAR